MVDPRVIAFANFMVSEFGGRTIGRTTGKPLNFDGRYGNQCMDLWNWTWTFLGVPSAAIHRTYDAAGVWELAATEEIWNYFDGILPDQVFQPGDTFVFNRNAFGSQGRGRGNGYGHIGMVMKDNLNGTFDVLEANGLGDGYEDDYLNQFGSAARVHTWSKTDLYGVLRPIPDMCPGLQNFAGGIAAQGSITSTEEDDMPLTNEDVQRIATEILNRDIPREGEGQTGKTNLRAVLAWFDANNAGNIYQTATEVLNRKVPWFGFDGNGPTPGRDFTTLALATGYADTIGATQLGQIAALKEVVQQLAVKQGVVIDYDLIAEKAAKAVNDDAAKRMVK